MTADVIDSLLGLDAGAPLSRTRAARPQFVEGAQACREAVLAPQSDLGLGHDLRAALAARMARLNGDERLAAVYRARLDALSPSADLRLIASGGYPESIGDRPRAILRHADLVTMAPRACTRADTERLVAAGVTVPQVIALTELIGFLNFETRIVATLNLLGGAQ